MNDNVHLSHAHQFPFIPTTGKESVYILLELNVKDATILTRPPINLSLVLDRSGSMSGAPLQYCKQASKFVVNQLSGQDLFNMVIFDEAVETVLTPQKVVNKDLLKNQIDLIETRGITNLSGGLIQGCQNILKQDVKGYVNRVILLSDGNANAGITNQTTLTKIAEDYHTAGAVITTMGVSEHFDEDLMEGIADAGKGNFYFIDKVEEIPEIFAKELEGLLSVVAQNVSLKIQPVNGVQIKNISGYNYKEQDNSYSLTLGDLYSNETKSVLIEFSAPPRAKGMADLFQIDWSFVDVTEGVKEYSYQYNIPIEFSCNIEKLSQGYDKNVEKQVEITKSAQLLEQALHLFDEGKIEEGKSLLHKNALHLEEMATTMEDTELSEESAAIMDQMKDFSYSKRVRKELHAEKYRKMKRRKKDD